MPLHFSINSFSFIVYEMDGAFGDFRWTVRKDLPIKRRSVIDVTVSDNVNSVSASQPSKPSLSIATGASIVTFLREAHPKKTLIPIFSTDAGT